MIRRRTSAWEWEECEYTLFLAKSCLKCGRRLTDPTSIEMGIGPECRKSVSR